MRETLTNSDFASSSGTGRSKSSLDGSENSSAEVAANQAVSAREALETLVLSGLEQVEERLKEETATLDFKTTELVSHLRAAGGKRMRPVLTLLASLLSPDGARFVESATAGNSGETVLEFDQKVIDGAVAVELTHLASLYHDDLMDDATVRRGVEAAHLKWNNTLAVMAGDLIFARSSHIISTLGSRLVGEHAKTFERLCLGQMHDIFGPEESDDPIEFYIHVLREKTGALIGTAAHYGAVLSGCDEDTIREVTDFGEDLGVAFQIADDVLDLQATVGQSGKTPGADLLDGTRTMPVLLLEKRITTSDTARLGDAGESQGETGAGAESDRQLLEAINDTARLQDETRLAEVVARLASHEVTRETVALAAKWVDRAVTHLDAVPAGSVKTALVEFAHLQINRLK